MFAQAHRALVGVWSGISAGLSMEVASTMATSHCAEWDKTPVRAGHASPRCLLKWEVHLSLSAIPLSFLLYLVFFLKRNLFNGPLQWSMYSNFSTLLAPWGSRPECVCIFESVCVCGYVYVRPQRCFNDGWSCQLCPTQRGLSDMRACWTFWRDCEDHGMQISYPSR